MDLENYFRLNFALIQYHKYSLTEIENMMPWERDIYVELLRQHLKEEKEKQESSNQSMAVTKTSDPIDILLEMGIDLDNLSEEEDYLSALKEAIAKIQFQTKGAGDERQRILQEEVIKVRKSRKAADPKFKAKKTKVSPDAFFDKKKPEEASTTSSRTESTSWTTGLLRL